MHARIHDACSMMTPIHPTNSSTPPAGSLAPPLPSRPVALQPALSAPPPAWQVGLSGASGKVCPLPLRQRWPQAARAPWTPLAVPPAWHAVLTGDSGKTGVYHVLCWLRHPRPHPRQLGLCPGGLKSAGGKLRDEEDRAAGLNTPILSASASLHGSLKGAGGNVNSTPPHRFRLLGSPRCRNSRSPRNSPILQPRASEADAERERRAAASALSAAGGPTHRILSGSSTTLSGPPESVPSAPGNGLPQYVRAQADECAWDGTAFLAGGAVDYAECEQRRHCEDGRWAWASGYEESGASRTGWHSWPQQLGRR
ncbi:hypothetical protein V8E36_002976 [Tilletia maclaganii]